MGTSRAQNRRAHRNILISLCKSFGRFAQYFFLNNIGAELAQKREYILAAAFYAESLAVLFNHAVEFFDNEDLVNGGGEVENKLIGQRINHTEFEV